jgi:hypothetical protein
MERCRVLVFSISHDGEEGRRLRGAQGASYRIGDPKIAGFDIDGCGDRETNPWGSLGD